VHQAVYYLEDAVKRDEIDDDEIEQTLQYDYPPPELEPTLRYDQDEGCDVDADEIKIRKGEDESATEGSEDEAVEAPGSNPRKTDLQKNVIAGSKCTIAATDPCDMDDENESPVLASSSSNPHVPAMLATAAAAEDDALGATLVCPGEPCYGDCSATNSEDEGDDDEGGNQRNVDAETMAIDGMTTIMARRRSCERLAATSGRIRASGRGLGGRRGRARQQPMMPQSEAAKDKLQSRWEQETAGCCPDSPQETGTTSKRRWR
jgi:hypothetical protein